MAIKRKKVVTTSLSIVIPAYNEEDSLGFVLLDTLKHVPICFKDYEIIVVDDGSTDKTPRIADSFAKKNKHVTVIHQKNGGYNKAMIAGLAAAKKEYVTNLPGDGQIRIGDMEKCFPLLPKYDLVLTDRGKPSDYSPLRLFFHYGSFMLYRLLFGITYNDPHWLYFWKTKEIQKLTLDPNGGVFLLVESLVKFKRKGLKITEVETGYRKRMGGEQKAVKANVIMRSLRSALNLKWHLITGNE